MGTSIKDFFIEDDKGYFLLEYKGEKSLKSACSYQSLGKTLNNRYLLIRGIASGGFGSVYFARDLTLAKKYWAIKEMLEEGDASISERSFRIEAEIFYETFAWSGCPFGILNPEPDPVSGNL